VHLDSQAREQDFPNRTDVDAARPEPASAPRLCAAPAPVAPDLTPLPRVTASTIEMLAEAAATHFAGQIRISEALLERARPGRYRDAVTGEIAMRRAHLAEARLIHAAARRRRTARLEPGERDLLDEARARNPHLAGSDMEALLRSVPADPLDVAGIRLDSADGAFRGFCASGPIGEEGEERFGRLQSALEAARAEYRRLLAARAGQDARILERRLAI
jgi:hypothetical protein